MKPTHSQAQTLRRSAGRLPVEGERASEAEDKEKACCIVLQHLVVVQHCSLACLARSRWMVVRAWVGGWGACGGGGASWCACHATRAAYQAVLCTA